VQAVPAAQQSSAAPTASALPSAPPLSPAASASPAAADSGPAATVQAYFADINAHDYPAAWKLSEKVAGPSYADFSAGLNGTAEDTVTIVSVNGDQVTVQLVADQTDGTVKDYSGVYTVVDGSIVQAQVQQTN
jgi:eukaryotic-like serine/threonine-protein kinase